VVDLALQEGAVVSVEAATRARTLDRLRLGDAAFRHLTRAAAVGVLVLLSGVIVALIDGSLPALRAFGLGFLVTERWNPVTEQFGSLAPIYGTLITSLIAMLIAVPVGLMIAFFLTELCPPWLRRPIGIAIELLAGIPSIIYGIWGLFVFAPFLQATLQPFLIRTLGNVPGIAPLFSGPPYGIGVLTAGLILAIMVLPFVTSISRDVFEAVPPVLKEAAYGVGCTTWEVVRNVVLPYARIGVRSRSSAFRRSVAMFWARPSRHAGASVLNDSSVGTKVMPSVSCAVLTPMSTTTGWFLKTPSGSGRVGSGHREGEREGHLVVLERTSGLRQASCRFRWSAVMVSRCCRWAFFAVESK